MDSLRFNISVLNPNVIIIQETKIKRKSQIKLEGYRCFSTVRGDNGGGILVACLRNLEPALVFEGDSECEVIVVQLKVNDRNIRIIGGYGPQECAPSTVRETYRSAIEEQISRASLTGCMVLVAEDANAKLGPEIILGDPHTMSDNGKLLAGMIARQGLKLVNTSSTCRGGPITRKRNVKGRTEESCIDFIMVSEDLNNLLMEAVIDSNQIYTLTKYTTTKGKANIKRSDHHPIIATFKITPNIKIKRREEIFKLRNEDGLKKFNEATTNCPKLLKCVEDEDIETACNKWYKQVDRLFHQCFTKIKLTDVPPKKTLEYEVYKNLEEIKILKEKKVDANEMVEAVLQTEIENKEQSVSQLQGDKMKKTLQEKQHLLQKDGTFNLNEAWKLKKKVFPLSTDAPFAVLDNSGNLVTEYDSILDVMKEEFKYRLRNREIDPNLSQLKEMKEYLCELRLEITKNADYSDWKMEQLESAIKKLKRNKCRDPHGHINEIYRSMGKDGLRSLLKMLNAIKAKLLIPEKLILSNVSTIYKGKGSKQDVINLRGIFKLPIIRNLLDRLVYFDEKDQLGPNMGQFQVGNQTGRNIRDHTLVIHAVVNEAQQNRENIDIQFSDIKQCFDSIWLDEATNDLYDNGVISRNLNLLYEGNRKTKMLVETNFGRSDRTELNKVVMQGSVLGGMICSNQLSKLCNKTFRDGIVYMYRGRIPIPALAMVDDVASIAKCNSVDAIKANSVTDSFIRRKKLEGQTGAGKCQWVHAGNDECRSRYFIGDKEMTRAESYKYLGDFVSNGWDELYKKRTDKARGYSATCLAMSTEMSLGIQLFSIAKLLHRSIFVNGTLVNMETWPHCTEQRMYDMEKVEQNFMRKLLKAHSKTPIETLYLELGILPLRFYLMERRVLYFHEVMNRPDDELTKQIVVLQKQNNVRGDFYPQVQEDLKKLGIEENMDKEQEKLRKELSEKVNKIAYEYLIKKAKSHSKVNVEMYKDCNGAEHIHNPMFTPDTINLLFRFRTHTYLVKNNFRNNYINTNILCPLCEQADDSQEHLFECRNIIQVHGEVSCTHSDIFSHDSEKLHTVALTLRKLDQIRDELLNEE